MRRRGDAISELRPLDPDGLAPSGAAWSQVVAAGEFVFVSGQVAWNEAGSVVGEGSIEQQAEQVFDNLERALTAANSELERLVRMCVYLVDQSSIRMFRNVRDRRLKGARPSSTLLIVHGLADPRLLIEIDAVALGRATPQ